MHEPTKQIPQSSLTIIHMHKLLPSSHAAGVVDWRLLTRQRTPFLRSQKKRLQRFLKLLPGPPLQINQKGFYPTHRPLMYLHICICVRALVCESTTTVRIFVFGSLVLWGCQRDGDAGWKTTERKPQRKSKCVYVCVWEKRPVFTWQEFISALWSGEYRCLKKTHRGKGSWLCVWCLRKKKSEREKDEAINNFFIAEPLPSFSSSHYPSCASQSPPAMLSFTTCLIAAEWWGSMTTALINLIISLFINVIISTSISMWVFVSPVLTLIFYKETKRPCLLNKGKDYI